MFICASSHGERAPGETPQEQAEHLSNPLHMTYVYVGKGMTAAAARPQDTILTYEHLGHHNNQGMNFLYADGHVEFHRKDVSQYLIEEITAGQNPPRTSGGN